MTPFLLDPLFRVRYEYHVQNFLGFVHLGCMLVLLRRYF